jgi:hypothetical protein
VEVCVFIKDGKRVDTYFSNEETKDRMAPNVSKLFDCPVQKRCRSIDCQAGDGKVKKARKKSKKQTTASANLDDSGSESEKENNP